MSLFKKNDKDVEINKLKVIVESQNNILKGMLEYLIETHGTDLSFTINCPPSCKNPFECWMKYFEGGV